MSRYTQKYDGDVIVPQRVGRKLWAHKIECCDCGLVHRLRFTIVDGKPAFAAWRDNRATVQRRKSRAARSSRQPSGKEIE